MNGTRIYSNLVFACAIFLIFSCSRSVLEESEENKAVLNREINRLFGESYLLLNRIRNEVENKGSRPDHVEVYEKSLLMIKNADALHARIDDYLELDSLPYRDLRSEVISFLDLTPCEDEQPNYSTNQVEKNDLIGLKFLVARELLHKIKCLANQIGSSDISFSLPRAGSVEAYSDTVSIEFKEEFENLFLTVSTLDTYSIYPDNDDSDYLTFIESSLAGTAKKWLQINQIINHFPLNHDDEDLNIYAEVNRCPWNTSNQLMLLNFRNTGYDYIRVLDISVIFSEAFVKRVRLLGFEGLEDEEAYMFLEGEGELYPQGDEFTILFELESMQEIADSELATARISYKMENGGRILSEVRNIRLESHSPTDDFRFLASVAEAILVINESAYKGNASIGNVLQQLNSLALDGNLERRKFMELLYNFQNDTQLP